MTDVQIPSLRTLRLLAGASHRQLARDSGVSYQTIRRLEAGGNASEVPLGVLMRMSRALETTIAELLAECSAHEAAALVPDTITLAEARLLRKIATTSAAEATLTKVEREITLPALLRMGAVLPGESPLALHPDISAGLLN